MTDRDRTADAAAHKVVDVLLPMFVNGKLDADERALVERHLRDCAECRNEVDWLRELHAACIAVEDSSAGSRAARRMRRQLEAGSRSPPSPRMRAEWRWAAAGAFAAAVALSAVWVVSPETPATYRTLGASATPANAAIVVQFDPATSEFDLRRIVRSAGGRIVDGPTQTNAYVLDVPAERRVQALQALRAERAVVLAERIDSRTR